MRRDEGDEDVDDDSDEEDDDRTWNFFAASGSLGLRSGWYFLAFLKYLS